MSEVKALGSITGSLSFNQSLIGTISEAALSHEIAPGEYELYEDAYEVTPAAHSEQTLKTANKALSKDIVVKQIPYRETSNTSNGVTAYIGE